MKNNRKYKEYPRIFSISTIGIVNHNNSDFLIHPLRTDFTGSSGSGKSLLTDLLQLILVASKNHWKSPTEDNDNTTGEQRDIHTLVLKSGEHSLGYVFANIETEDKKFITIGVFINRGTEKIHSFIIQKGISWEFEKNNLKSFQYFLTYKDFFIDKKIPQLEVLKQKLNNEHGLQLQSFYNKSADYHKHLFNNGILHIDLSKSDDHLKSYAEVLQYFGRGKAFDGQGNKSTQIKNFLFVSDNKEKEEEYQKQKAQIEKSQRNYTEQFIISERVKKRKDRLLLLLNDKIDYNNKLHEMLWTDAIYFYNKERENEKVLNSSKKDLAKGLYQILYLENKINNIEIKEIYSEIDKIKASIEQTKGEKETAKVKKENISANTELITTNKSEKEGIYKTSEGNYKKIEKVENWLSVYSTIDDLKKHFENQLKIEEKKKKLNLFSTYLNENKYVDEYEKSKYFLDDFQSANQFYSSQLETCNTEIESLNKLKPLFDDSSSEKSLVFWFRNNIKKLSKEQEEILFHFKDKATEKPTQKKQVLNFIPNPETFFSKIEIIENEKNGFWINLNGISEFIESKKEKDLLFNNPKTIQDELNKFGQNIKKQISEKESEKSIIEKIQKIITDYKAFNQEICEIYKEKTVLENVFINATLKIHEDEFTELINFYNSNQSELIKDDYAKQKLEYEKAAQDFLNHAEEIEKLTTLIKELGNKIEEFENSLKDIEKSDSELFELIKKQEQIKNSISLWNEKLTITDNSFYSEKIEKEFENSLTEKEKEELTFQLDSIVKTTENTKKTESAIKRALNDIANIDRENKGKLESEIIKSLINQPKIKEDFARSEREYEKYIKTNGKQIKEYKIIRKITDDVLNTSKEDCQNAKLNYEANFKLILNDPELSLEELNKNILQENFDYTELVNSLLPGVVKNPNEIENTLKKDIEIELNNINAKMLDFAGKNLMIIKELFGNVEEQYEKYIDKIKNLEDFFKANRAAGSYYVELKANPSNNYPIKWIKVLKQKVHTEIFNTGIWRKAESKTADEIIKETFKEFSNLKNFEPSISKLLDPKSYFDLNIEFKSPTNENAPPSTGQGYAILALLNIAKLSLIDNHYDEKYVSIIPKGIRYMPIDEVAGLGENFDMLYKIAEEYDYQILTMTITANDNEFETGNQYSYTLRKNSNPKDPNRNLSPFAIFTKYNLMETIEPYIEKLKDEFRN